MRNAADLPVTLRESELRLRGIAESQLHLIVGIDRQGRFTFANDAYCRKYGLSRENLIGRDIWRHLIHPDDLPQALEALEELERPPHRVYRELRTLADEGVRWVAWEASAILDDRGGVVEFQATGRDIHERKQAEEKVRFLNEQLRRRAAELEAANHELEAFAYSVSHDLRAPLRAIDGFSRILVEDHAAGLDDEAKRVLGVIVDNARRMGQLIEDLLEFSRVIRCGVERTRVDLTRLAEDVVRETRREYPGRSVEVSIEPLGTASGDESMLRQVFANLVANAFKFTGPRERARVEITQRRDGAETVYEVRDNGVGFDPRYVDKLFKVFQRLHSPSEFEGTGIGLALVQRIVARHGGRVWASGAVNGGATFSFTLPDRGGSVDVG
ncbi:MAG: ATP-binding protein [Candidatus Velamenicoccus archaeovorus]